MKTLNVISFKTWSSEILAGMYCKVRKPWTIESFRIFQEFILETTISLNRLTTMSAYHICSLKPKLWNIFLIDLNSSSWWFSIQYMILIPDWSEQLTLNKGYSWEILDVSCFDGFLCNQFWPRLLNQNCTRHSFGICIMKVHLHNMYFYIVSWVVLANNQRCEIILHTVPCTCMYDNFTVYFQVHTNYLFSDWLLCDGSMDQKQEGKLCRMLKMLIIWKLPTISRLSNVTA